MTLDVSEALAADGVSGWSVGPHVVVGARRLPAGRLAAERHDVEWLYCFGLSDTPWEVEVEGEGAALLGPDMVRFHNVGDRIRSRAWGTDACADSWIVLSGTLLEAILAESGGRTDGAPRRDHRPFPSSFVKAPLRELAALRAFLRRVETGACPFWIEEAVSTLLPALLRSNFHRGDSAGGRLSDRQRALAREADALLVRHHAGALSLGALAAGLGVTAPHLARAYKLAAGHGMHARLTALRIGTALRHLAEGADDITALALDLGFASHSHFTAAFSRHVGASPSAFRRSCRGDQKSESAARRDRPSLLPH